MSPGVLARQPKKFGPGVLARQPKKIAFLTAYKSRFTQKSQNLLSNYNLNFNRIHICFEDGT